MTIYNLDGVNPLDRNSWRTSVRRCQVLPTPESETTAAPYIPKPDMMMVILHTRPGVPQFVCLFAWGLTTLSAQIGYIAP